MSELAERERSFSVYNEGIVMYQKLESPRLRVGMYVVNTGVSWLSHPYLYMQEGELGEHDIQQLLAEGYTEAYVDLTQCRPGSLPPELEALAPSVTAEEVPQSFLPLQPKIALAEELPKARRVFRSSLNTARDMMASMRKGSFDLPSVEPMVEDILGSLDRNADALLGLCKLRQADDYTYTHCINVSVLATIFARGLGFSDDELHSIGLGGLFHDLGKARIPLHILNAPRRLNDKEMAIIRLHPQFGYDALKDYAGLPKEVGQMVLEHHEQYQGEGYPHKLPGQKISLVGRIGAVVDVFDALSSRRVYKEAMPLNKALSILYSMRGKELFPGMVERFIRLLGVFPVGSGVELEDGSIGVVSMVNPSMPLRPRVILLRDKNGKNIGKLESDLSVDGAPGIVRALTVKELGVDPADTLGIFT